jgi:hypothetical protein
VPCRDQPLPYTRRSRSTATQAAATLVIGLCLTEPIEQFLPGRLVKAFLDDPRHPT